MPKLAPVPPFDANDLELARRRAAAAWRRVCDDLAGHRALDRDLGRRYDDAVRRLAHVAGVPVTLLRLPML